jgi:DNA-binding NtrC family response regulator
MAQAERSAADILLVDDDPIQVRIREAILRDAGFTVAIAMSAEAALDLVRARGANGSIGAIVTDHILPGASGAEFVRLLRAADANIPVVVVTGLLGAEEEYRGLAVTFRQKPLAPNELIATVRSALGRS